MADQVRLDVQLAPGVKIRKADNFDASWMASRLRKSDEAELKAATPGEEIVDILLTGIMYSDPAYVLDYYEDPVLMFGVIPHESREDTGIIWAVGTDNVRKVRREIVKFTREWLKNLGVGYKYLTNMVDARNTVHIRWLQWAGAQFHRSVSHPMNGLEFLEFSIDV